MAELEEELLSQSRDVVIDRILYLALKRGLGYLHFN